MKKIRLFVRLKSSAPTGRSRGVTISPRSPNSTERTVTGNRKICQKKKKKNSQPRAGRDKATRIKTNRTRVFN